MFQVPGISLALELATDGLAGHYRGVEGPSREAAEQYVLAEESFEAGDWSAGLHSAAAAMHGFRACRNEDGVADALHLVIVGHLIRAEMLRYSAGPDANDSAGQVLKNAEQLALQEAIHFRDAGNKRGEGFMLLAAAEVNYNRRGTKKRDEAKQLATRATELSWDISDKRLEAAAAWVILHSVYKSGQRAEMLVQAQVALELFRAIGDVRGQAKTFHMLGVARLLQADFDSAVMSMMSAVELLSSVGARKLQAVVMCCVARVHCKRSCGVEAARWAEEALEIAEREETASPGWKAAITELLVRALAIKGDHQAARQVAERAVRPFASASDKRSEITAIRTKAALHLVEGNWEDAINSYEESHVVLQDFGDIQWKASSRFSMAVIHLRRGDSWSANRNAKEAAELYGELKDDKAQGLARLLQAQALLMKGEVAKARELATEQKEAFQASEKKHEEAECQFILALCFLKEDEVDKAIELVSETRHKFGEAWDWLLHSNFLLALTRIHVYAKRYDKAIQNAKELRAGWNRFGDHAAEADSLRLLSQLLLEQGRGRESLRAAGMALTCGRKSRDKMCLVEMLLLVAQTNMNVYGRNATLHGTPNLIRILKPNALKPANQALSLARASGMTTHTGSACYMVGVVNWACGQSSLALEAAQEAVLTFRQTRDRSAEAACTLLVARVHADGERLGAAADSAKQAGDLAREAEDWTTLEEVEEFLEELLGPAYRRPAAGPLAGAPEQADPGAPGEAPAAAAAAAASAAVQSKSRGLELDVVVKTVQEMAKAAIGLDDGLSMDSPLMDSGLDSLSAVSFRNGLASHLGVKLPSSLMFDYPTMRQVADKVVQLSEAG